MRLLKPKHEDVLKESFHQSFVKMVSYIIHVY